MRRSDRQLPEEQAYEILKNGEYGVLATVSADGQPYGVPMSYAYADGIICMHCSNDYGMRLDNLRGNAKVSFTVVGSTELMPEKFGTKYASAICFGTVQILAEREEKQPYIEAIMKKYSPGFEEGGMKYIAGTIDKIYILKMSIDSITGKARVK